MFYEGLSYSKHINKHNVQSYTCMNQTRMENKLTIFDEFLTNKECREASMAIKDTKSLGLIGLPNKVYHGNCSPSKHCQLQLPLVQQSFCRVTISNIMEIVPPRSTLNFSFPSFNNLFAG